MIASAKCLNGNYDKEWSNIDSPVLLLHGKNSWAVETQNILEMARKDNVILKLFENTGHTIRDEKRKEYIDEIKIFLSSIN